MIHRLVKMSFQQEKINDFLSLFHDVKPKIEAQVGCHEVNLLQDTSNPGVIFTYSTWENDEALQNYRKSELFAKTWKKTKTMFAEKAAAWSAKQL